MNKLVISGLIFSLALMSGCQLISGFGGSGASHEDSEWQEESDEGSEQTGAASVKEAEQQPERVDPQAANAPVKPAVEANADHQPDAVPPDTAQPSSQAGDPSSPSDANVNGGSYAFKDLDELKKYIEAHPEEAQKHVDDAQADSNLPVKSIKCHVHANDVNTKFFEETNKYDELYSEEGLMKSYCDEKTINYYGSREFDFECYEVQKNNHDAKVKGGFEVTRHIRCPIMEIEPETKGKGLTLLPGADIQAPSEPQQPVKKSNGSSSQDVLNANFVRESPRDMVNLRCDIDAGGKSLNYTLSTNTPEKSFTLKGLEEDYCTSYHIKATGLIYDFDCYQVEGDGVAKVPGGYHAKFHVECPDSGGAAAPAAKGGNNSIADCDIDLDNTVRAFKKSPAFSKAVTIRGYDDLENARPELTKEFCSVSGRDMDRFFISCCFRKSPDVPAGKPPCSPVYYGQIICN